MYMVGGGSSRVHRDGKPYPGATRWLSQPSPVYVPRVRFRIGWQTVCCAIAALLLCPCVILMIQMAILLFG